jgi:hypothetical protein
VRIIHGFFGHYLKNGGSVLQQLWHVKESSLLKAMIAKHWFWSLVMVIAARYLKKFSGGYKQSKKQAKKKLSPI